MDMSLSKLQEIVKDREVLQSMGWQRVRHNLVTEYLLILNLVEASLEMLSLEIPNFLDLLENIYIWIG